MRLGVIRGARRRTGGCRARTRGNSRGSRVDHRRHPPCSFLPRMDRRLDSGAVLSRARPVLTFATHVPQDEEDARDAGALEPTPTPSAVLLSPATRVTQLPVIARIVRRRTALDAASPLLSWLARAPGLVRRSGAGTMVVAGLVIGTLGAIAGHGLWSLPSFVSPGASSTPDATGSEPLLARDPLAPRIEHVGPPRIEPARSVARGTPAAATRNAAPFPAPGPRPATHAELRPLVKPPRSHMAPALARR